MRAAPRERLSDLATRSCHEHVLAVDRDLLRAKADDARRSARGREIHVLHAGDDDPLQRMLNAVQPGSYITPHRHVASGTPESIVLLQGSLGFVGFPDDGAVDPDRFALLSPASGGLAVDCRPRVWHTFFALEPDTVVFEVKLGPYDADADKAFAPWAPREGAPGAAAWLAALEDRFRSHFGLPRRAWTADPA
jgi:cupin fold WbuC family metalloprotein